MPNDDSFAYSGTDNLEVMAEAKNYNAFLNRLVEQHTTGAMHVIDFGAGIGTFAAPLQAAGRQIIAIEPDAGQRRHMESLGLRCAEDISHLEDNWADAIYTMNVLEHIEDDLAALRTLNMKLRPGGRLLIYVPAFQILFSSMDRKVGHYRRYNKNELTRKVLQAGFHIAERRYADSLGFLATLLYLWLGSDKGDINREALKLYDGAVFPVSRVIDRLASPFFGKNLYLLACKPKTTGQSG